MAARYNYRYGETNPVSIAWASGTAVLLGDMVYVDILGGHKVKPAGSFVWNSDTATTQGDFHKLFAGVAAQTYDGSNANGYGIKDGKLRVDTEGVFQFDTASASYRVGDLVGPAKASGNALEPQKVALVATESLAIGRVVEATSSSTTVKVRIFGRVDAVLSDTTSTTTTTTPA